MTIDRQATIDIVKQAINNYCAELVQLPSAQPEILQDGTLVIDTDRYSDVKRVLVEHGTSDDKYEG